MKKPLHVMKFGGTSVGDASCIARVVQIVRDAAAESSIVVVVSAMSGVTNRLIEAAHQARAGNSTAVAKSFAAMRSRHEEVVAALIPVATERSRLQQNLDDLFLEGDRLCEATATSRELTPQILDAFSGLGERLCAPIVAAALAQAGVSSEAIEATELVVTDSVHGEAEPRMEPTRKCCQSRLTPLIEKGVVPVVTGFIAASEDGVLTTLGRGGSDYSATLLGAAVGADEVVIWTDVNGLLTADPKSVPEACTIPEISYHEAAELAHFGAKVLHSKALRPVVQSGIPVWIKNTFDPALPGTKITPAGPRKTSKINLKLPTNSTGVIAITGICGATPGAATALVTVVGKNLQTESPAIARALATLRESHKIVAVPAPQSSDCSLSFTVPQANMEIALVTIHRELGLGLQPARRRPVTPDARPAETWQQQSEAAAD